VPAYEPPKLAGSLLRKLLEFGQVVNAQTVHLEAGEPSECHANVVSLWRAGRGAVCNGFALSDDGLWRSHSWLSEPCGHIVETTELRTAYFGSQLDDHTAEVFAVALT
jgi:hypothetical protein